MKKKTKMIFSTIMIIMMVILTVAPVFAAPEGMVDPKDLKGSNSTNTATMQNIGNQIITVVSVAGSIVSVIVLVVLGIKYMMGSAEEKAEYKKTLMPYIIGAALVFAASAIAGVVFNFASSFSA